MKSHHRLALNYGLTALWFTLALLSMEGGGALAAAVAMSFVSMLLVHIFTEDV